MEEVGARLPEDFAEGFVEGFVAAGGFRIRYVEAGQGPALLHLHGAGGLRLTAAHRLLAERHRLVAFEMPGFGFSPENTRSRDLADLAAAIGDAATALGIGRYVLWGTSFGGKAGLWLAVQRPEAVTALVLEAPAAIRPPGAVSPAGTPEQMARLLYAHPERMPPMPAPDPAMQAKQRALVARLRGPDRDADLERCLADLAVPALVLFGTRDRVIPPEAGRVYKQLLPNCHLVLVYDAGHAIAAERPEAFAEVAGDFLERGDAFAISRTETLLHP